LRADTPEGAILFPVRTPGGVLHFCRPADPDAVLNKLTERDFERDEQLPYWAEHWPAADVAVEYFAQRPLEPLARVCEIGCGLGVLTTILSQSSHFVVGADISEQGCQYAAINLRAHGRSPRVVCTDWRAPPFREPFDVIIGVDILYEERWVHAVGDFLQQSLAEGGMAIIADPCRTHWGAFREYCGSLGFASALAHRRIVNQGRTCVELLRIIR
jgi:predicted nicotinamide N-methyase